MAAGWAACRSRSAGLGFLSSAHTRAGAISTRITRAQRNVRGFMWRSLLVEGEKAHPSRRVGFENFPLRLLFGMSSECLGVLGQFRRAHVLDVRRDRPVMTEPVNQDAVAIAPELVGERKTHGGAGRNSL